VRYLEAIERGKFHTLPGGAYGLSYVRQYAQAIHCDPDELIEQYREQMSEPVPPPADPWTRKVWRL
jgi:cytoskeletal protein RodZ